MAEADQRRADRAKAGMIGPVVERLQQRVAATKPK
jgi:hypothetical protein